MIVVILKHSKKAIVVTVIVANGASQEYLEPGFTTFINAVSARCKGFDWSTVVFTIDHDYVEANTLHDLGIPFILCDWHSSKGIKLELSMYIYNKLQQYINDIINR